MTLLSADSISKTFSDKIIFKNISFTVKSGDRIGLVGKNGVGKTTIFETIFGNLTPDTGSVSKAKNCRMEYVLQDTTRFLESSLFDFVISARQDLLKMKEEIESLDHFVSINHNDRAAIEKLGLLQHQFEIEGGFNLENEITAILDGLGFEKSRHHERLKNFSGGEKNRAALARILAGNGNLLLLDEPTNHLDIESTTWLEDFLKESDKACLIVSHDRAFLTATVQHIWELSHGRLETYTGGFERYVNERHVRREQQQHQYIHQRQEIERIEDFIRRNMAGQKTKQAQSKLKYLQRLKRIEAVKSDGSKTSITMQSSGRSFAHVLTVDEADFGYGDRVVLEKIRFDLYRGDKAALIGRNGSGKTTLLKALTGELAPMSGEIKIGSKVEVAYFDQELENLNGDLTVLQSIWELEPMAESGAMRSYLARFGFTGDETLNKVSSLSGGEKTKLSLALLLYHPANFIILDEPTNHLDIDSREALEEALLNYDGSCLIVSHDRYFLDKIATKVLHISDGRLRSYDGNYSYFKEKSLKTMSEPKTKITNSKSDYFEVKEKSKRIARHQKEIKTARTQIESLEKELVVIEEELQNKISKSDWEKLHTAAEGKRKIEEQILVLYDKIAELEKIEID